MILEVFSNPNDSMVIEFPSHFWGQSGGGESHSSPLLHNHVLFYLFSPAFNILVNVGVVLTYPILISIGTVLSVPGNAGTVLCSLLGR